MIDAHTFVCMHTHTHMPLLPLTLSHTHTHMSPSPVTQSIAACTVRCACTSVTAVSTRLVYQSVVLRVRQSFSSRRRTSIILLALLCIYCPLRMHQCDRGKVIIACSFACADHLTCLAFAIKRSLFIRHSFRHSFPCLTR